MEELLSVVARASDAGRRGRVKVALGSEPAREMRWSDKAAPCRAVYKEIGRVAERPVSIMILGETGTGKELVARALWQHGDRQSKAFVAVNCAAIPANLLESELFGHERGAFTGAESRRIGRFEQADGGHPLSGRDRRPFPGNTGQAPSGAPGAGDCEGGRAGIHA